MSDPRRNVMNRLLARILVNTSDSRGARLLARDLHLLNRDSDESDEFLDQNSDDLIRVNSLSDRTDSDDDERILELIDKPRCTKSEEQWIGELRRQPRKPHVMRHLVLDFLMRASMKDAAETFIKEAGIEVGEILESKINKLVNEISLLLDQNKILEIEEMLDSIDPQIKKGNVDLLLDLKVFHIRKLEFEDF